MAFQVITIWTIFLYLVLFIHDGTSETTSSNCHFTAIYNFGDSNSDTGGYSAAINAVPPPNGELFFGKPSGRACDGRLIIDFIAEHLELPYLSAYLDSIGACFKHGANFATGGSSIRPGGYSPFHLGVQVSQFKNFKARIKDLYGHQAKNQACFMDNNLLPKPDDFSKALYTIDIGQNDLYYGFQHTTEDEVRSSLPDILHQFSTAIQQLYSEGARIFWVHNTGPLGCLPNSIVHYRDRPGTLDRAGCVRLQNEVAQEFNQQLRYLLTQLQTRLDDAIFRYVDVYSAKYALISNAKNEGFVDPVEICCGASRGYHVDCGKWAIANGSVNGVVCSNPRSNISWDGVHYSEAANQWVATHVISGSLSDSRAPISEACVSLKSENRVCYV